MMRRTAVAVLTLALVATAAPASGLISIGGSPSPGPGVSTPVQAAAQLLPSSAGYAADAVDLGTGDVWRAQGFDMTVHDFLTAGSPVLAGVSEVRVAVSLRNTSEEPLPFSEAAFFSDREYAELRLLDSDGVATGIDVMRPNRGTAPMARLHQIEPGMTARWVVGFRVPTPNVSSLTLEAIQQGLVRASWSLSPAASEVSWMGPDLDRVAIGDSIAWSEQLEVTPGKVGSFVCGDPSIEVVSQIVAVTLTVTNSAPAYVEWPGVRLPDEPAIASWSDGSSAAVALETFSGESDGLWRHSGEWGFVPPLAELERAFVFAVPRDGRLGDVDSLPSGVALFTAAGQALWLDLSGAEATIGLDPLLCDLGVFGGPIPFSFQPNGKFEVAGEGPFPDDDAADLEAQGLIASAIAAAAQFFDGSGLDLDDFDLEGLAEFAPSISFEELDLDDLPDEAVGTVYWGYGSTTDSETGAIVDESLIALTESESGLWVCSATELASDVLTTTGATASDALTGCVPTIVGGGETTEETTEET